MYVCFCSMFEVRSSNLVYYSFPRNTAINGFKGKKLVGCHIYPVIRGSIMGYTDGYGMIRNIGLAHLGLSFVGMVIQSSESDSD